MFEAGIRRPVFYMAEGATPIITFYPKGGARRGRKFAQDGVWFFEGGLGEGEDGDGDEDDEEENEDEENNDDEQEDKGADVHRPVPHMA